MTFDFDKYIDRVPTGSMKWSFPECFLLPQQAAANPLPLRVADMDFQSPPAILEALKHAVDHTIMGYTSPTQSCVDAVCRWQKRRFDWAVDPAWLVQTPGVVTALNIAIQAFTNPGDSVLIQPPVYVHFREDVQANDRSVTVAPLELVAGQYVFNPETFEAAIKKDTKLFILCNPHNPTGNVWSESDLRQMGEICNRHNVLVISDEIHQDLIFNRSVKHMTFAKLGEEFANNCIVCTAPSKTFNIAGLQISNIFIPNQSIRNIFVQQANKNGLNLVNCLGLVACEAAYEHGEPWLESVLDYIRGNQEYLAREIQASIPKLKVIQTDALYLAWIDCRELGMNTEDLMNFLTIEAKVWFDNGVKFGKEGHGFMRVNVGCTRATLIDAVERLKKAINAL